MHPYSGALRILEKALQPCWADHLNRPAQDVASVPHSAHLIGRRGDVPSGTKDEARPSGCAIVLRSWMCRAGWHWARKAAR